MNDQYGFLRGAVFCRGDIFDGCDSDAFIAADDASAEESIPGIAVPTGLGVAAGGTGAGMDHTVHACPDGRGSC